MTRFQSDDPAYWISIVPPSSTRIAITGPLRLDLRPVGTGMYSVTSVSLLGLERMRNQSAIAMCKVS